MNNGMFFIQISLFSLSLLIFIIFGIPFIVSRLKKSPQKKTIAFVHLDLGVGGAERLVVDAATAIQSKGYKVLIVTCNHPLDHCFPETKTVLNVQVHGNFLPAKIAGRFHILCSVIRMWFVSWMLVVVHDRVETIFCDGVSACIPILKCSSSKVIFYCHFPDQLLVRKQSFLRSLYRMPMNYLEEITTGMADKILVNSKFTQKTFSKTFTSIKEIPTIIYPCVNVARFDDLLKAKSSLKIPTDRTIFLSINRFDPNKKIEIAIEAFAKVYSQYNSKKALQLVIAEGGYDSAVADNFNYLKELQELTKKLNLKYETLFKNNRENWSDAPVLFLPDLLEQQKIDLLKYCHAVLYTPSREHFGIVPIEAMLARRAVIAVRSGGLKESITEDGLSGILCKPATGENFASAMESLIKDSTLARDMGEHGRERAVNNFSWETLGTRLDEIAVKLSKNRS